MSLITLRNISITFEKHPLLDGADFSIEKGEKVCLIGRNGEGKSTLLKIIAEEIEPDDGEIEKSPSVIIEKLSQEVPMNLQGPVFEVVKSGFEGHGHYEEYKVQAMISRLSLNPETPFQTLSGGQKRRVLFAKALVSDPDLLLLDEPTNHLDLETIEWLENLMREFKGALLFITHDRTFLQKIATRIVELDRGKLTNWGCDYKHYLQKKEAALIAEEQANKNFDKKQAQEEHWIRHGITARRKRNQGRVRRLLDIRQQRQERRMQPGKVNLQLQQTECSGKLVIEAKDLTFIYGTHLIMQNFSTSIMRGDKIGIMGANGSGKTTLLKLLLKELEPQSGSVRHGTKLQIAHFDQLRSQLNEEQTLRENVSGGSDQVIINGKPKHIMSYLRDFLFTPEKANMLIRNLSGGERNRLLLAKLFTKPANVLVLDEPTNDLDLETLELLEDMLVEYEGTLLLVSHDRTFLNNVVTSTIVFEKSGAVAEYVGGYDDWLRQRPIATSIKKEVCLSSRSSAAEINKPAKAQKLSYEERKELNKLPRLIEKFEAEQAKLHDQMAEPDFYQQEQTVIQAAQSKLQETESALEKAYARWEELEK